MSSLLVVDVDVFSHYEARTKVIWNERRRTSFVSSLLLARSALPMDFFRTQSFLEAAGGVESIQVVYLRKHPSEELLIH